MVTIGVYQSWSNSVMYEYRYQEKIKKLYKSAGKYHNQHQYKAILVSAMVVTTEVGTDNSSMYPIQSMTFTSSVQENHSVNFWKHWMSNIRLLYAG